MRRLRHVASPDEVRIRREPDGETAVIEYAAADIGATHFKIGPALKRMTDAEVLERFDETIAAMDELRRDYKHVAIEVPIGQPQIEWLDLASQWCARGQSDQGTHRSPGSAGDCLDGAVRGLEERLPNRLVSVEEAAEHLSISVQTVRRWCKGGQLAYVRRGRELRIDLTKVRALTNAELLRATS